MTGKEEGQEKEDEGEEVAPALVTSSARKGGLCMSVHVRACAALPAWRVLQRLTANKTQGRLEL